MLKAKIGEIFIFYALQRQQKLQIGVFELEDDEILADRMASSNVVVSLCLQPFIQVFVKGFTKTRAFDVTAGYTTMDLMIMVAKKEGVPTDDILQLYLIGGNATGGSRII